MLFIGKEALSIFYKGVLIKILIKIPGTKLILFQGYMHL